MDFLFSCFGTFCFMAMLWSNIFSQSLYDDNNRQYDDINRDSKLVVIQSLLHKTETILKDKDQLFQEMTQEKNYMFDCYHEIFEIYRIREVPRSKYYV